MSSQEDDSPGPRLCLIPARVWNDFLFRLSQYTAPQPARIAVRGMPRPRATRRAVVSSEVIAAALPIAEILLKGSWLVCDAAGVTRSLEDVVADALLMVLEILEAEDDEVLAGAETTLPLLSRKIPRPAEQHWRSLLQHRLPSPQTVTRGKKFPPIVLSSKGVSKCAG